MEYTYIYIIYIKTILKLDPDFITDDRTKCLLMRAILGHGRCLLCFRSMVLSNKKGLSEENGETTKIKGTHGNPL
jgi:hypothetical protein